MSTLAIDGGTPVTTRAMPPWPHFDDEMIVAVTDVLRSGRVNYWTGTECREFEREYAEYTGSKRAIAVANGTVSLELALAALGIGPGDEVVTTPLSVSWQSVSPGTYAASEAAVSEILVPYAWDPVILTLLSAPGFAVFLGLALIFYLIGRRPERRAGRFASI